jgi:hypothetical protein
MTCPRTYEMRGIAKYHKIAIGHNMIILGLKYVVITESSSVSSNTIM